MPNGAHAAVSTPRPRHGEPQPAPPPSASEPASARRDLTSWWKQFSKRGAVKKEEEKEPEVRSIFGVPLITSIPYANVAISLFNETGESYIYGYVPIVVAKCGVFLKEKATDVEGIFRLAGSEKRIKELKVAFDTPPRWGKGLDWTGYTVHDAANILRRYFNQLPEPIIPLQHYDPFREPLRNHQAEAVGHIEGQAPSVGGFDPDAAVRIYQHRIKELPSLNRQLLLYILDLLAVFAAKSDVNKMTTSNLAAIFQPGILSHPQHDMSPQDYRLSQDVLIFLIDNQDHFLIGMEGTAVDEGTVKHVESGPPTPQARTPTTPGRNKTGLGRSASAASSAGAESLRKFGGIRRNVSTSSRQSRHSGAVPSPTAPAFNTPPGSGVHRSNTLPSNRSPALSGSRFAKGSDTPTPAGEESKVHALTPLEPAAADSTQPKALVASEKLDVVKPITEKTAEEGKAVVAAPAAMIAAAAVTSDADNSLPATASTTTAPATSKPEFIAPNLPIHPFTAPPVTTPSFEGMPGAFPPTPGLVPPTPADEVNPFAAQHSIVAPGGGAQVLAAPLASPSGKRSPHVTPKHEKSEFIEGPIDGGLAPEPAQKVQRTFTQILSGVPSDDKQGGRKPNKLQKKGRVPSGAIPSAHSSMHSLTGPSGQDQPPSPLPHHAVPYYQPGGSKEVVGSFPGDANSSRNSGVTLKPSMSPSASFRSHSTTTEYSENEQADDGHREERRSFWKSHRHDDHKATASASQTDVHGSVPGGDKSLTSVGSSNWGSEASSAENKEHGEKKSHFGWFKRHEHKERADKKHRAQSPPGSSSELSPPQALIPPGDVAGGRGRSMDVPRSVPSGESSDVTPTATVPNPLASSAAQNPTAGFQAPAAAAAPASAPIPSPVVVPAAQASAPKAQPSPSLQPHYRSLIPEDDADPKSPTTPTARGPA